MNALQRVWELVESWLDADGLDLVLRLTLVQLLVAPWLTDNTLASGGVLRLMAAAGLALPGLQRSAGFWGALSLLFGLKVSADWYTQDNHHFLFFYTTVALCCALWDSEPARAMHTSARWLLAGCFAFATVWKGLLSDTFVSGAYLEFTLLTDLRFADLVLWCTDMTRSSLMKNAHLAELLTLPTTTVEQLSLERSAQVTTLARVLTVWTLLIESATALLLLFPHKTTAYRAGLWLLLLFSATTYLVIPNVGVSFGWTLLLLVVAASPPEDRPLRATTGLALLWVLVGYLIPWFHWATEAAGVGT